MKALILSTIMAICSIFATGANSETLTLSASNTLSLNDSVNSESVAKVMADAMALNNSLKDPDAPLYLVLFTPGGSIGDGLEMINFLASLGRPVHTVTIAGYSMGFISVQLLGNRYMTRDGTLMSHKARGSFSGEFPGQIDSRYSRYLKKIKDINKRVVARTNGKHTVASYESLMENEYWCDGRDCVDAGFAWKVVDVVCDKSLSGTFKKVFARQATAKEDSEGDIVTTVIELADIYSKCPMITSPLGSNIYINNKPVFQVTKSLDAVSGVVTLLRDGEMKTFLVNNIKRKLLEHKVRRNRMMIINR